MLERSIRELLLIFSDAVPALIFIIVEAIIVFTFIYFHYKTKPPYEQKSDTTRMQQPDNEP